MRKDAFLAVLAFGMIAAEVQAQSTADLIRTSDNGRKRWDFWEQGLNRQVGTGGGRRRPVANMIRRRGRR